MIKKGDLVHLNPDQYYDHNEFIGIVLSIEIRDIEWFDNKVDECTHAKVAWFENTLNIETHTIDELEVICN